MNGDTTGPTQKGMCVRARSRGRIGPMMQTAMLAVAAFQSPSPAHRPLLAVGGGRGATACRAYTCTPRMLLPDEVQDIVDNRFYKKYPAEDLDALWAVLKEAYVTEADALRAVTQNPTVLNPLYTNPPELVTRSKEALVEVMGEEEALEVMLKNPAVLQCGSLRVNRFRALLHLHLSLRLLALLDEQAYVS